MSDIQPIIPGRPAPDLAVPLVGGGRFSLRDQSIEHFALINVYRGKHCPICKKTMQAWDKRADELKARGLSVLFLSADDEETAEASVKEWEIENLKVGWGFELAEARKWGLFISQTIKDGEPEYFTEPGLFLIDPEFALYASFVQTVPFARPGLDDLLSAIDFVAKERYPARGKVEHVPD
ncbi:MAG: redoxin domain-containing protein [Euryhalocaulis sp.]|uniref:redoxin domain-containing protein n=1 Tax=Euryhalocaulis sp. TaxID=2744307 RepID=UPI0017D78D0D|nr:redoxin domain-containing protein [Euryhalocaulis sp.]MBA4801107.1 redoxin domain-containing protein [Euryhalocaulis sp.]